MSGDVKAVWIETTINYSYTAESRDVEQGVYHQFQATDNETLKSLEVRYDGTIPLAVKAHLEHVRKFAQGKQGGSARFVNKVHMEVCANVDDGRTVLWIPVYDKECQPQPLTEGSAIPEEATVAALFRGAQLTTLLLGPVSVDTATAKQETPAIEPVKSGANASPGPLPQRLPAGLLPNISWEIEP